MNRPPPLPVSDRALQLLTLLSRADQPVARLAMAMDASEYRVVQLVEILQRAGYLIATRPGMVRVQVTGWTRCRDAAEAYYDRAYGD
ncbi:MAG TPA: hypothetical protein VGN72_04935 [Tepidisphaeraceae bacterium]|nr:hypothetical protein [Tepidisphaeraceae bacterium]